jgi:hypothetical protein
MDFALYIASLLRLFQSRCLHLGVIRALIAWVVATLKMVTKIGGIRVGSGLLCCANESILTIRIDSFAQRLESRSNSCLVFRCTRVYLKLYTTQRL